MAELQHPNMLAALVGGQQAGMQMREAKRAQADNAMLRGLAPQVIAGDPDAYAQAAAVDPAAAGKYQQAGDSQLRRLRGFVNFVDQARASGNMTAVNAALREGSPFIGRFIGKPGPTEWTPDMEPGWEALKAKIAMADEQDPSKMPSGFREFQMTAAAAGLKPGTPEYQQAANIALGREGRAATGGFGFELVEGLDGRKRLQRRNPRTGAVETYDEASGNFVPFGSAGGGMPGAAPGAAPGAPPPREASGMPVVFDDPGAVPPQVQAAIQANPEGWGAVTDGTTARIGPQTPPAVSAMGISRSPEEEAAAVEDAKQRTQLGYLPQQQQIETQGAIDRARGVGQAEADVERETKDATRVRDADRALTLLEEAEQILPGASGGLLPATRDAVAGAVGVSTAGAQANAQLKLIAAELIAKVPRFEGPQSNIDVQFYREAAGDLANERLPVETRLAAAKKMRELRERAAGQRQNGAQPARVQSAADYAALPSGALYVAPDGTQRRKR